MIRERTVWKGKGLCPTCYARIGQMHSCPSRMRNPRPRTRRGWILWSWGKVKDLSSVIWAFLN